MRKQPRQHRSRLPLGATVARSPRVASGGGGEGEPFPLVNQSEALIPRLALMLRLCEVSASAPIASVIVMMSATLEIFWRFSVH